MIVACRCRWSTGNNGDIWVLQIEPDESSSTAKSSPKDGYSALPGDDVGPDGPSTRSPSVVDIPRADEIPLTSTMSSGESSTSSSSSLTTKAGLDRSKSDFVDLSVAHVIRCCRQPPWDQLLPVTDDTWRQPYGEPCSRRTYGGGYGWRTSSNNSACVQSPAELQRLLHVTSV